MILGVNGYHLGKKGTSHDASAALFSLDGKLIAAAEEERFTRNKHAEDVFPHNAIEYCLREAHIAVDQVTDLAIGWNYTSKGEKPITSEDFRNSYFPSTHFGKYGMPAVHSIDHHLAHASSSYLLSGFDEANVIVVDGKGEDSSTSLFVGSEKKLEKVQSFPVKDSLGFLMEELGNYLGMGFFAAGKVMGLASYGKNQIKIPEVQLTPDGYFRFDIPDDGLPYHSWNKIFDEHIHAPHESKFAFDPKLNRFSKVPSSNLKDFSEETLDVALTVQKIIEEIILRITETLYKQTGIRKLCLSGGVALNCPTNTRLLKTNFVDDIYIFPAANDAGVSVGAAAHVLADKYDIRSQKVDSPYVGPGFTDAEIGDALKQLQITNGEHKTPAEIAALCADDLATGKIVGWFQGRMEMGPRALGNRSILANPAIPDILNTVNTVKGRELWRPLAIAILDQAVTEYLRNYTHSSIAPYMLTTATGMSQFALQNVAHVDGTTRPQVVTRELSPTFYAMISEFEKKGGVPFVINTSFNRFDEPVVCSPRDAIKTFYSMGLHTLYLGNFILRK